MVEKIQMTDLRKEMSKRPATMSKYAGLGAAMAPELMHWSHISPYDSEQSGLLH